MANVLKFEPAFLKQPYTQKAEPARDEEFNFWPEVSRGLWVSDTRAASPENSQGRVLLEMLMILGVTAAIAFSISFFVGAPPV